jgi:hypothetical protein
MRPAATLKGCFRWSNKCERRRRESNPCTGLCRPLPKPLGHSAQPSASEARIGGSECSLAEGHRAVNAASSGRRDSNPRPSPWQGDALPTEPRPHASPRIPCCDTSGLSAGSLRRCVRTLSDPRPTTNSKRGLTEKFCLPSASPALCSRRQPGQLAYGGNRVGGIPARYGGPDREACGAPSGPYWALRMSSASSVSTSTKSVSSPDGTIA